MALSKAAKNTIDVLIPAACAGVVAWFLFRRTKKVEYIIGGAAIVFVLAYLVTSRLTKVAFVNGPTPVPTGGGCDDYDPTALGDALYNDITGLSFRNHDLYTQLLGLADCQLRKVYNYWNERYYSEDSETLPVAISNETGFWDNEFRTQQAAVKQKFSTLNLQ